MRKIESFKRLVLLCMSGLCLAGQIGIYAYYWYTSYYESVKIYLEFWEKGHWLVVAIYGILLLFFSNMYGGMRIGYLKNLEVIFSQIFATLLVNIITYCQISLMVREPFHVPSYVSMMALQAVWVIVWIMIASMIYKNIFPPRKLLLVHGDRPIEDILRKFASRKDKFEVSKCMHIRAGVDAVNKEALERYDAVVLWDISVEDRNKILKFCYGQSIRIYLMPKIPDVILKGAEELHLFDTPLFLTREYVLTIEQRFMKRCIDLFCSLILFILASPFMLLTALAVKLYDGGPVLYKQVRCTTGGRQFSILKFRSMRVDAEKDGVARLAAKNDSRITPVGKFIRKVRLDELPQLLNIIRGDMSFIGPRPERPEIIAQYMEVMPEFVFRMKVKAGLAGYAQVYGKYNTTPYDKLKLDLAYIENYSVWLDLKLMLLTLKVLLWPDSTEGVENDQITAMKQEQDAQQEKKMQKAQAEATQAEDAQKGKQ
ncbi:MAG: exopolysaccharide biosynthesis polyprenyl glycosylphosphotransferase [Lachnospiraceae bacterium]|nr:exopolysaccharide biosynthesis polyprenyl glycosylphosphotransferase [Lachnospiraceae bacterium]